jgi:hypothetical protein
MKTILPRLALGIVIVALTACSGGKGPAEQAIKAAEAAYDAVKDEALKYVPDQARDVERALSALKGTFNKGDYKAVMTSAQEVTSKVKDLSPAILARKDELTKNWTDISAGLPKMVDAIRSRLDILSQSKKVPAGLDKAKFESAKAGLAEISQVWTEASDAFKSGDLTNALAKAKAVKNRAVEIMTSLGMKVPAAATG